MNRPRHAASTALVTGLRLAIVGIATLLGAALTGIVVLTANMARRVVTPAARVADLEVKALDTTAQTITLSRTPDTVLPGRYGLFANGAENYLKLGSVLAEDATSVKRKLLTHIGSDMRVGRDAAFSGWYYDRPEQLHLPFTTERIGAPIGPCPAWLFPAGAGDVWVIQIHGRGASRAETLRAVPLFHDLGITTLNVSYRNDGEAPRSRTGTYGLGATEWQDVDAAVAFARRSGARRIVLMGWSMGGAIAMQVALNSRHRDVIAALVLDSPVVDWRVVLGFQARALKVPGPVTRLAMGALGGSVSSRIARTGDPIPFDKLNMVARADELTHPVLLLHSDDDGFVPSDASHALAEARPDLVTMHTFTVARHTKLWNYDERRWSAIIADWLRENALEPAQ